MFDNESITLLFVGDFIPPETSNSIYSEELKAVLKEKDFSIVNLETPLTERGKKISKTGNNFRRPPSTIKHVKDGYFDAVALSNNHIRDYGNEGVLDTIATCKQGDIKTVGAGKNIDEARKSLRITIKGKKISILNYSEHEFNIADEDSAGANPYETINAFQDIKKEKKENEYVIVVYHGGLEYQYYPTPEMIRKFKYLVDVGADAVICHHTHRYSGSMVYKEKPILFGLGNFVFNTKSEATNEWLSGVIIKLLIEGPKINFELIPTIMNSSFNYVSLHHKKDEIKKHMDSIGANISNKVFFTNYWKLQDEQAKQQMNRLLKSKSKLHYRFRKYLPFIFRNKLTTFQNKVILNMLSCESHRERLIRILRTLVSDKY